MYNRSSMVYLSFKNMSKIIYIYITLKSNRQFLVLSNTFLMVAASVLGRQAGRKLTKLLGRHRSQQVDEIIFRFCYISWKFHRQHILKCSYRRRLTHIQIWLYAFADGQFHRFDVKNVIVFICLHSFLINSTQCFVVKIFVFHV